MRRGLGIHLVHAAGATIMNKVLNLVLAVAIMLILGGCGSGYMLQGRAVEGGYGTAMFVSADDDQLNTTPVAFAEVSLYRDAGRLNQALVAKGRSNGRGEISIAVEEFGAGWMEEQWLIQVVKSGYEMVESIVVLPRAKDEKRLLIVLSPGRSLTPPGSEDLWKEVDKYR